VRSTTHRPEHVRQTVLRLRREGESVRTIAKQLGVPKSTVGDWIRGQGEPRFLNTCWCGERFYSTRWDALSCSPEHSWKRARIFGPVRADERRAA
jgi:hypothetical protein